MATLSQDSCLENFMDKRAWQATVHGVSKSQTHEHTCMRAHTTHTFSLSPWSKAMFSLSETLCLFCWLPGSRPSHQEASLSDQDHNMARLQRAPFMFCGLPGDRLHWS